MSTKFNIGRPRKIENKNVNKKETNVKGGKIQNIEKKNQMVRVKRSDAKVKCDQVVEEVDDDDRVDVEEISGDMVSDQEGEQDGADDRRENAGRKYEFHTGNREIDEIIERVRLHLLGIKNGKQTSGSKLLDNKNVNETDRFANCIAGKGVAGYAKGFDDEEGILKTGIVGRGERGIKGGLLGLICEIGQKMDSRAKLIIEKGIEYNSQVITFGTYKDKSGGRKVDTDKVFDNDCCVMHIIKTIEDDEPEINKEFENRPKLIDSTYKTITYMSVDGVMHHITNQCYKLWNMMKRGDVVFDISTLWKYVVDIDLNQPLPFLIVRNKLVLKELEVDGRIVGGMDTTTTSTSTGSTMRTTYNVMNKMYTITEFPIGYFDKPIINDYFYNTKGLDHPVLNNTSAFWKMSLCPVVIDTWALKLNNLTKKDVTCRKFKKDEQRAFGNHPFNTYYVYKVVEHKKVKYLIINRESDKMIECTADQTLNNFITKMNRSGNFICRMDPNDDDLIKQIIEKENIDMKNVLMF
jgi:hypothetical protein